MEPCPRCGTLAVVSGGTRINGITASRVFVCPSCGHRWGAATGCFSVFMFVVTGMLALMVLSLIFRGDEEGLFTGLCGVPVVVFMAWGSWKMRPRRDRGFGD